MPRTVLLSLAAVALWNVAFAVAPRFGPWLPIAAAALLLDALALGLFAEFRRPRAPTAKQVGWGLGAAAVQIAATYLLYRPALDALPALRVEVAGLLALLGRPTGAQAFLALPLVVLSEELVHRGAIQLGLSARLGTWGAAVLAPLVYAVAHLASGSWALVAIAAICGLYWALVRAASGGLWAAAVCHLLWDVAIFVVWPLEV